MVTARLLLIIAQVCYGYYMQSHEYGIVTAGSLYGCDIVSAWL